MLLLAILKRSGKVHISLLPVCHLEHEVLLTKHCLRKKKKVIGCGTEVQGHSLASCKSRVPFFFNIAMGSSLVRRSYQDLAKTYFECLLPFGFALSYGEAVSHVWLELLWVTIFFLPGSQQIFCYLEEMLHHRNHQCEGFCTSVERW